MRTHPRECCAFAGHRLFVEPEEIAKHFSQDILGYNRPVG